MNIKSFLHCLFVGVLTLCSGPTSVQSQNVYCIGPSATGDGSGKGWANLKAWNASPTRGDTWYLEGGSYPWLTFNVATSATNLITIKKTPSTDHYTDTGWNHRNFANLASAETEVFPTGTILVKDADCHEKKFTD